MSFKVILFLTFLSFVLAKPAKQSVFNALREFPVMDVVSTILTFAIRICSNLTL